MTVRGEKKGKLCDGDIITITQWGKPVLKVDPITRQAASELQKFIYRESGKLEIYEGIEI